MKISGYSYMVIEDDLKVCEGIQRRMRKFPHWKCLGLYTSYTQALKQVITEKPDLLFLDWAIKGGNTFELLNQVKNETHYHPYLIFFTGYGSDLQEIQEKMVNIYKVHHYFSKPIWEKMDLYLAECLVLAENHVLQNRKNESIWIETASGEKVKIHPKDCICINQSENPRNKILCFSNIQLYEIKANWEYCETLLKKFGINYFVVNKRESIINLDCIEKIETNLLRLKQNIQVKISREKLKELEMML